MIEHIDELAELYAIGTLDELERARVERHVATCPECAARLHDAEAIAGDIAQSEPLHEAPARLRERLERSLPAARPRAPFTRAIPAAIAAALLLALVPAWVALDRTRTASLAMRQDEEALARIAATPFQRAQFMSPRREPMDAKVLYGKGGDWYYIVVMHPKPGMQVAYVHDGTMQMLGRVAMHGASGTLYLPIKHKMEQLALLEDGTVVARAHLAY